MYYITNKEEISAEVENPLKRLELKIILQRWSERETMFGSRDDMLGYIVANGVVLGSGNDDNGQSVQSFLNLPSNKKDLDLFRTFINEVLDILDAECDD